MKIQKRTRYALILLFVAGCIGLLFAYPKLLSGIRSQDVPSGSALIGYDTVTMRVGNAPMRMYIADTDVLRIRGLSGSRPLKEHQGMLFVFDEPAAYKFWMKDMLYVIDMIWLDAAGNIIGIESSVEPASYPSLFGPDAPSLYVVECNAGCARERGLHMGDRIDFGDI